MSLNTLQNNTTANTLYKSSAVKNASEANGTKAESNNNTDTGFGQMFAQAVSAVPSKTLSPEALAATVPSTTIQTSAYVFDPLGVVGQVPESNTFLQAIRAMLGKPLEVAAAEPAAPVTAPVTTSVPASLATTFGALPAATSTPAPVVTQSAVSDVMSAIEAQLNYQASTAAPATPTPSALTAPTAPAASASDLVEQYIANASAAAVASVQSALANSIDQDIRSA